MVKIVNSPSPNQAVSILTRLSKKKKTQEQQLTMANIDILLKAAGVEGSPRKFKAKHIKDKPVNDLAVDKEDYEGYLVEAEKGVLSAQMQVARCLYLGVVVEKNPEKLREWMMKAYSANRKEFSEWLFKYSQFHDEFCIKQIKAFKKLGHDLKSYT